MGALWPSKSIVTVESVEDLLQKLSRSHIDRYDDLVWRGVADIDWWLDSALARKVMKTNGLSRADLTEQHLVDAEDELISEARRLQFDRVDGRRLEILELLARLQHNGAATRLLDVTTNVLMAAWFAVEDTTQEEKDAAIFGVAMTGRVFGGTDNLGLILIRQGEWPDQVSLWYPSPVDVRIRAQQGAFIFSTIPSESRLRNLTTLNLDFPNFQAARLFEENLGRGRTVEQNPTFILRLPHSMKPLLRLFLAKRLGFGPDVMYPDLPGFARSRGVN